MRNRIAKLFLVLSVAAAFGGITGVAQAKHGADDVNNNVPQLDGANHT
jgi:hypothetical protein